VEHQAAVGALELGAGRGTATSRRCPVGGCWLAPLPQSLLPRPPRVLHVLAVTHARGPPLKRLAAVGAHVIARGTIVSHRGGGSCRLRCDSGSRSTGLSAPPARRRRRRRARLVHAAASSLVPTAECQAPIGGSTVRVAWIGLHVSEDGVRRRPLPLGEPHAARRARKLASTRGRVGRYETHHARAGRHTCRRDVVDVSVRFQSCGSQVDRRYSRTSYPCTASLSR
jgi:hypothetical protein